MEGLRKADRRLQSSFAKKRCNEEMDGRDAGNKAVSKRKKLGRWYPEVTK